MADRKMNILVADDEPAICDLLAGLLTTNSIQVDTVHDGAEAMRRLDSGNYALCIADLRMPGASGLDVLRHIRTRGLDTRAVLSTGHGALDTAVEALRHGAFDYITKPVQAGEIRDIVERALATFARKGATDNGSVGSRVDPRTMMIGESSRMQAVFSLIEAVADSDSTVLILGESGTGKELVARTIHEASSRARKNMVPVNCGALPENLLESELFGHVRGAFTGAVNDRPGRFKLAHGGTIFLDEIGEMPPQLQVRLLRVLQEGDFEPVGATGTTHVDVRVVAATNRNLDEMVADKSFREDLYYRLNVIPICLPPLRERLDDLDLLIAFFTECFELDRGRRVAGYDEAAMAALRAHPWPGNVRELENLIERCSILHNGKTVTLDMLPDKFRAGSAAPMPAQSAATFPDDGVDLNQLVDQYETSLIMKALEKTGGVKNRAAQLLNIKRTTLVEKMKKKKLM